MKPLVIFLLGWSALAQERVNPDARIVEDFENRVTDYVNLQKSLAKGMPVPKPTIEPEKILDHQHELAKRIRAARKKASQGEIFTPEIAREFHRLLGFANQGENNAHIKKSLERSEPVHVSLRVNESYPAEIPLQSMPPTVLMNLPALPPGLEYRFANHALVLRDATANIVVDLIPNAVP